MENFYFSPRAQKIEKRFSIFFGIIVFGTFGTIVNIFHLQEKKFKKKGKLLNLDLQWKNTPYAKIRVSLAACD